jgi:hypothetical protein
MDEPVRQHGKPPRAIQDDRPEAVGANARHALNAFTCAMSMGGTLAGVMRRPTDKSGGRVNLAYPPGGSTFSP